MGNDYLEAVPDRLLRGVSVEALGAGVPAGDHVIDGLADYRVVGGLHQRGQRQRASLLGVLARHDKDLIRSRRAGPERRDMT
jgi:hypothetical protein